MQSKPRRDNRWLLATAKQVALKLRARRDGTRLRIRTPNRWTGTNTDGWAVVIGDLGKGQPSLEIWLDRFSGYDERKLYACFCSADRQQIFSLAKRASSHLGAARVVSERDIEGDKNVVLSERLGRSEFNMPILENYVDDLTFYGIYDATRDSSTRISPYFCSRAVAFFEDVARALPNAKVADEHRDVYPQIENRKLVASHLQRERSRLLATECKIRDKYECQVCGMHFENVYGPLGKEFAEAHHLIPLGQLDDQVTTRIEDLMTVCANCHRMLHRMPGDPEDVKSLITTVRQRRRKAARTMTKRL